MSDKNHISITQSGSGNRVHVAQDNGQSKDGEKTRTTITTDGNGNEITITQRGDGEVIIQRPSL